MQIHFTNQFPWGEPSYFVEKIWSGFAHNDFLWYNRYGNWSTEKFKDKYSCEYDWFSVFMKSKPKITTIREDSKDRWKKDKLIHFEQWTGIPYRSKCFHFAPVIPCMGTQKIEIEYTSNSVIVWIDGECFYCPRLGIDKGMLLLANNDGFDSKIDFFNWFRKGFKGKIIHWTPLQY